MDSEETIINLKILQKLEKNQKLITRGSYLNIEPPSLIPECLRRWNRQDNRHETIKKINTIVNNAIELINKFCSNLIEKTRHIVIHDNNTWEVDEFKGLNAGLIVAEIELTSEDDKYSIPKWIDKNVTEDLRYANSNLSIKPFTTW